MAKPIHLVRAAATPAPAALAELASEVAAPEPADALRVLEVAALSGRRGVRGAMATVIARHGSAPGTPGQKLFVADDGTCVGTVGGGAVEREVLEALRALLLDERPRHEVRSFKLGAALGMCCGGSLDVLVEPLEALVPLLVVGGGHVATAAAPLLARLGFAVTVVDARDAWGKEGRLPDVTCVVGDYDDVGRALPRHAAVLVMTHDHALDQEVIAWALGRGFAFVGGVGSRAKAKRTRDRLAHRGFTEADCARVRMPIGVDVGARLPEEIAVAIAAEMIGWRRAPKK